jgi:hypothetical protein
VHDAALDVAKRKSLVIAKKMIELMAVRRKRRLQIENGAEVLLDLADTFADPDLAAEPRQCRRRSHRPARYRFARTRPKSRVPGR